MLYLTNRVAGFHVQNRLHFLNESLQTTILQHMKRRIFFFRPLPSLSITFLLLQALRKTQTLSCVVKKKDGKRLTGFLECGIGESHGGCEQDNVLSVHITFWYFLDQISKYNLIKENSSMK
jgi:hypothetical protein